jgi:tetratricopeptide (TPR) repeat protein
MKKISLLLVVIFAVSIASFGQNNKVVAAYNYLQKETLDKALESIESAVRHRKTKDDEKAWFYRGNVYVALYYTQNEAYKNLVTNPLDSALKSYEKSLQLDDKEKYKADVLDRIKLLSEGFFNEGVTQYNEKKNYSEAFKNFKKSMDLSKQYKAETDTIQKISTYYAANSLELDGKAAEALPYYKEALEIGYRNPSLYSALARVSTETIQDTVQALNYLSQGRKVYPDDFNLIIAETNIFLAQGNTEKALENLKIAVKKDTSNATIWFAVGTNYERMMNQQDVDSLKTAFMNEAINAYEKALEINPDYFKAVYNLGAIYTNRARDLEIIAGNIPFDQQEKYDSVKKLASENLEKARPYLEKALEIEPDDLDVMRVLKEIYARTNDKEKLSEINKRIAETQEKE